MSAADELGRLEREIDAMSASDLKQPSPGKGKRTGSGGEKRRSSLEITWCSALLWLQALWASAGCKA